MIETIYSFDPKKYKKVKCGIYSNGIFKREVKPSHFHRITQSYGMQENIVEQLKDKGCQEIHLVKTTGDTLVSKFSDWLADDIKVLNYGHGKQRFFPVNRMRRELRCHR